MSQQITVFGANGKVGRLVVEELLLRGHTVVAFVHNDTSMVASDNLRVVQGDIYAPDDVTAALAGSTVVVSTLGSWGTPKKDILATGMKHIIAAMKLHNVHTIVSLTGADARAPGDRLTVIHRLTHLFIGLTAGKILTDGETHIQLLADSGTDWTVIRSPIMRSALPKTDQYGLSSTRPLPWQTIARRLVALAIVDAVEDRTWRQKAPFVACAQ